MKLTALALLAGCVPPGDDDATDDTARWAAPIAAVDLDPDPDVVEIDLVAEVATVEFVAGIPTEVWAYRDAGSPDAVATVPGPQIEAALGQRLIVHLRNELPQGTTLHWHGLRLPDTMDGNPMNGGIVAAGASATVEFELRDAGLHWYHPHLYADEQIQRGLQGTVLVRGDAPPAFDRERVLVLDDVMLDADGAVVLEPTADDLMLGRRGNALLVNGRTPAAATAEPGTIERWRLVNTSNGRYFALALGGRALTVIGWDGGAVAEPYETETLVIAPGERFDVLVPIDGDPGDRLVLETLAYGRGDGMVDPGPYTLLTLALEGQPATAAALELAGAAIEPPLVDDATAVQRFELAHQLGSDGGAVFTINGQRWPLAPALHVERGATEIWELVNQGEHDHPFHLHGLRFVVLDRDGDPEPTLGWKDTVRIAGGTTTRIAVRYDEPGMWMYHCTIPEHAERGMMGDLHVMEDPQ